MLRFKDTVKSLSQREDGYRVLFRLHAAIYRVALDSPAVSVLVESASQGVPVEVGCQGLEILEAGLLPPRS